MSGSPFAEGERSEACGQEGEGGGLGGEGHRAEVDAVHDEVLDDHDVGAGELDQCIVAERKRVEVLVAADVEHGAVNQDREVGRPGAAGRGVQVNRAGQDVEDRAGVVVLRSADDERAVAGLDERPPAA